MASSVILSLQVLTASNARFSVAKTLAGIPSETRARWRKALRRKRGGPSLGQAAQNGGREHLKLLISFPGRQRNLVKAAREAPSQLSVARCSGAKRSYLVKAVAAACCSTSGPKRVRSCELTPIDARRSKFAAANFDAKWRPERLCPRLSNYSSSQNLKSVKTITLDRIANGLQPTLKLVNTCKERNLC